MKENQLNIKWDMTGQSLQDAMGEGCVMICHNEWEPVKMSDQFTLLETGTGVLHQQQNKTTVNSFHILTFVPGKECRLAT